MNLRRALGILREGDPDVWRCGFCHRLAKGNQCFNHQVRVFRAPTTRPPAVISPPPARPIRVDVRVVR